MFSGRQVVADLRLLAAEADLDRVLGLLAHVVNVAGVDVLAPLRPVAEARDR